jgi:hypothetical protein
MRTARLLVTVGFLLSSAGAAAQPATTPPAKPAAPPAKDSPKATPPKAVPADDATPEDYKTADELLGALETADKKIQTISAELSFTTVAGEIEGNDRQIRRGRVWFRNRTEPSAPATPPPSTPGKVPAKDVPAKGAPEAPSTAAACVRFDLLILPDSNFKQVPENKTYIVNGPVMIEKIDAEKLVNRIRFASDEKRQDPLKLGEGPFPLPFGQKKDEVTARFDAKLVPALETVDVDSLKARLAETYQLVLTPKANAGISTKVKEVRVWYQKKDLLPACAKIVRPGGGMEEFYLIAMQVNKPLPPDVFSTAVPEGWKVQDKERP